MTATSQATHLTTDVVFAVMFLLVVIGIFLEWLRIIDSAFAAYCMLMLHNMRAQL